MPGKLKQLLQGRNKTEPSSILRQPEAPVVLAKQQIKFVETQPNPTSVLSERPTESIPKYKAEMRPIAGLP